MNIQLKELVGYFCSSMSLIEDDFESRGDMGNYKALYDIHNRFLTEEVTESMVISAMIIASANHAYNATIIDILNREGVQILKSMRNPIINGMVVEI